MLSSAPKLPDDPELLKAMITALQAENAKISATLRAHNQLILALRLRIANLRKQVFGKSSDKFEREIEQFELVLKDMLIAAAGSNSIRPPVVSGPDALIENSINEKINGMAYSSSGQAVDEFRPNGISFKAAAAEYQRFGAEDGNAASGIDFLQQIIKSERRHPIANLKKKCIYKLLRALAKSSLPISRRTRDRLQLSAEKRNPDRNDLSLINHRADTSSALIYNTNAANIDSVGYDVLVRQWSNMRSDLKHKIIEMANLLRDGPLISIIVYLLNPNSTLLLELIASIRAQSYRNWELLLVNDREFGPEATSLIEEISKDDSRVKAVFTAGNGDISHATNIAIDNAKGNWITFVDGDDLLDQDALLIMVNEIGKDHDLKILYTDEDRISEFGGRHDPHFKPDFNRELLYSFNYISHLVLYDAQTVRAVGLFRPGFQGAHDYDLLLRCIEMIKDSQIRHIPKVLYSSRAIDGIVAASNSATRYAVDASRRALQDHLERTLGRKIPVQHGEIQFTYRPVWPILGNPLVSIIIPTRDYLNVLSVAVESILQRTNYKNFEIVVVDNGSVKAETHEWLLRIEEREPRVRVIRDDSPFNYSALNNRAVKRSKGEIIALLNNDVEVIDSDWLAEMVSLAQRENTGCVGAKLLYPDGRIQHSGVVVGLGGVAGHTHHLFSQEDPGYFFRLKVRQEYSAVTGACLLVRKEIYESVGGLNEVDLAIAFNDVDFCLKVQAAGYHNVWTPFARLYHHESISRGHEDTPEKRARFRKEKRYMRNTWNTAEFNDPAYNVNLSLSRSNFSFAYPDWKLT